MKKYRWNTNFDYLGWLKLMVVGLMSKLPWIRWTLSLMIACKVSRLLGPSLLTFPVGVGGWGWMVIIRVKAISVQSIEIELDWLGLSLAIKILRGGYVWQTDRQNDRTVARDAYASRFCSILEGVEAKCYWLSEWVSEWVTRPNLEMLTHLKKHWNM